jgi:hypothetical protein
MISHAKSYFNLSSSEVKKYFGDVEWKKITNTDMN